MQTGALVGFMSKRVLGQYELVLPSSEGETDSIFFVGPNILALERAHQFNPAEFRAWIALHECAHRAQFLGVPWMKDYFLGLVSYSLYLWHFVVLQQADLIFGEAYTGMQGLPKFLVSLALVVLVSTVSYYVFERPFFRLGARSKPSGQAPDSKTDP